MTSKTSFAILLTLFLGLASLRSPGEGELSAADQEAIRAGDEAWARAANSGDFEALASLYTTDAVVLPANAEPVRGREAIAAFFSGFPPFRDARLEQVEIVGRGDLAYVWGRYSMKIELPGVEEPLAERGKYLVIWRKGEDGTWRLARDMFSSNLPLPAGG